MVVNHRKIKKIINLCYYSVIKGKRAALDSTRSTGTSSCRISFFSALTLMLIAVVASILRGSRRFALFFFFLPGLIAPISSLKLKDN